MSQIKRPSLVSYADRPLSRGIATPDSVGGGGVPTIATQTIMRDAMVMRATFKLKDAA